MLLVYLDFNIPVDIHTYASDTWIGTVISQCGMPVAFCSHKLTNAQKNCTITERELLAIKEALEEFKSILLSHQIKVYTNCKT
eukprot:3985506-Ditylum_brightwellii.AAC.2